MAELNFIYFKKLPLNEQNEFSASLSQGNEIGEIILKKSNRHLLTNLKTDYEPLSIDLENKDKVENKKIEKYPLQVTKKANGKKAKFSFRF